MPFLSTLVVLLAAAVVMVPLSRHWGFGSVLGYLVAGVAIGPAGFGLVHDVHTIAQVSEFGVVMLLFLIGLELRPTRLWTMRKAVLGLGGAQVLVTGAALAALAHAVGLAWAAAIVVGFALALSSTAIVLPMLGERQLVASRAGRDAFSVLLFQDMAFIPLIALIPLLGGQHTGEALTAAEWLAVAKGAAVIAVILVGGRYLVRSAFRLLNRVRTQELFTVVALLVVAGTALLVGAAGLSMSLGAFMAGVLLSDSEYRHELRADIEPFEGLLLGFFFMSVGMEANVGLLVGNPVPVLLAVFGVITVKAAVAFALGIAGGQKPRDATRFAFALPQGSEFGFVLFGVAVGVGAMGRTQAEFAMLVVALSMIATPVLFAIEERWIAPLLSKPAARKYDKLEDMAEPIIICGFGRVGQIVGRVLRMNRIGFTALDRDVERVEVARRFGSRVYLGDPTRPDLLRAAGVAKAKVLVVALDDMESSLKLVEMVRREFPHIEICARARDRNHAHLLMDHGVTRIVRETLFSSLRMSEQVLTEVGVRPAVARRAVEMFAEHDERVLRDQHAIYGDEKQLIQTTQQAARELDGLFEADRLDRLDHLDPLSEPEAEAARA
jgi:monovalent cation:proton antiporter-2 (CPA2) family protein